jgi:Tfp pilus assembly protein PilN|uniref:Fimbrial assembly family protein n=1 Tax=Desulfobacca acetoxidans TaxID=60893 RepID=A0A7C3WHB7_9BACT
MAWQKMRTLGKAVISEMMAGTGSLGAFWEQAQLTLVHLKKGFTSLEIAHGSHFPLPDGGLEALVPEIKELLLAWGLHSLPVSLAVSPQMGFVRQVTLPRVARENLAKVLDYELDRFLPLSADQLYFDYQIIRETETDLHITLMALPRTLIESWLNMCAELGLNPISVELAPTSVANAFALLEKRKPAYWLLFQTGDQDFDLIGIQNNSVRQWRSQRLPLGENLPSSLRHELEQLPESGAKPTTLFVCGPRASEIKAGLMGNLSLPVVADCEIGIKGLDPKSEGTSRLFPAVGAALRGVGRVPIKTNLLPGLHRAVVKLTGLFLTRVLLILLLSFSVLWITSIFMQKKVSLWQVERQLAQLRPTVQQIEKKLTEAEALGKQLQDISKMVEQYPRSLMVLKELTEIIPEHTHLYSLRLKKRQIELGGRSLSAADLISILEKSGCFARTEFVSPIVNDDTGSEIFKIKAEVKGAGRGS